MKAAVLTTPGGPENFVIGQRAIPVPQAGQVLIKVKAFGLNRSELMTRKGLPPGVVLPRVLGIESVGEVEADPSGALKKGTKVAAFMGGIGREFGGLQVIATTRRPHCRVRRAQTSFKARFFRFFRFLSPRTKGCSVIFFNWEKYSTAALESFPAAIQSYQTGKCT